MLIFASYWKQWTEKIGALCGDEEAGHSCLSVTELADFNAALYAECTHNIQWTRVSCIRHVFLLGVSSLHSSTLLYWEGVAAEAGTATSSSSSSMRLSEVCVGLLLMVTVPLLNVVSSVWSLQRLTAVVRNWWQTMSFCHAFHIT